MLKDTGERIIPELMKPTNGMLLEHIARYYFSGPYVRGRVLDIACGVGYGTVMVAKGGKKRCSDILGVDIASDTVEYACKNYYHPLVAYKQEDALDPKLPQKLGQFDTILSFETVEHVTDDQLFMDNLYAMLHPRGTLILSTPFGKGRGKPTNEPFHVHQLTEKEFSELFTAYEEVDLYYQRGVTIEPPRKGVRYSLGVAVCTK